LHHVGEILKVHRLDDVTVDAEFIALHQIALFLG
jgi:hypothetical protein